MSRESEEAIRKRAYRTTAAILTILLGAVGALAADWTQWGRDASRNAVSPEKRPLLDFHLPGASDGKPERNIAWRADLGSKTSVAPVVADGLVWVCTNARDPNGDERTVPEKDWDGGVLMCFRESDGKPLCKVRSPRLSGDGVKDFEDPREAPIGSAPLVEGDRLWYVNNRSETVCLDISPVKKGTGEPREVWKRDLRKEFGVFPHTDWCPAGMQGFGASVGGYKNWLYVSTRNSATFRAEAPLNWLDVLALGLGLWNRPPPSVVPAPDAPSLLCLEKATGKLVWKDNSPGKGILEFQESSPLVVEVNGTPQVIVGQGDGWLRSFDGATGKLLWKCDLNPKVAEWREGGIGDRNYVVATPVFYDGHVYIGTGQDFINFSGPGSLYCIDPTKSGDVSVESSKVRPNPNSAVLWHTPKKVPVDAPRIEIGKERKRDLLRSRDFYVGRMVASVTAHEGLLYAVTVDGLVHCFDAKTGKLYWADDLKVIVAGQPLWVDGRVIVTTEGGVFVYAHGKSRKLLQKHETDAMFRAGAVYANGTLYLTGMDTLFAVGRTSTPR